VPRKDINVFFFFFEELISIAVFGWPALADPVGGQGMPWHTQASTSLFNEFFDCD